MKPLILTADEVRAALAGTLTEIRRPVEMRGIRQTAWITRCTVDAETHEAEFSGDVDYFVRRVACPFGAPGDVLWCRETWRTGCRPHPVHGWVDGIEYMADVASLTHPADLLPLYRVETPEGVCLGDYEGRGWRSPVTMPLWASRLTLITRAVRVERVADVWTWIGVPEVLRRNGQPIPPREVQS